MGGAGVDSIANMPRSAAVHQLITVCLTVGVELDEARAATLLAWRDRLLEENSRVNLTGVRDPEDAVPRLIVDSLAVAADLAERPLPAHSKVVDLGTGGGVPGVPLAIAYPELEVHLVESRVRKADAVRRITNDLGLDVSIHRGRLGELLRQGTLPARGFDLVVVRAVAALGLLVKEAAPALKPGGRLVCWKADDLDPSERTAGDQAAARAGLTRLDDLVYSSYKPSRLVRYHRPETES